MTDDIDPDLLAIGAMMRQVLEQIARMKNPSDPANELAQMRQNILEDIANSANTGHHRAVMFDAVLRLMPLGIDRKNRN